MSDETKDQDIPDAKNIIWQTLTKTLGAKLATLTLILAAVVSALLEFGPKIGDALSAVQARYLRDHPPMPKFNPELFTVGIAIFTDGAPDTGILDSLRTYFFGHAAVTFTQAPISKEKAALGPAELQKSVDEWLQNTGASAVIWGEKVKTEAGVSYLLRWKLQRFLDGSRSEIGSSNQEHVLTLPPMPEQTALILLKRWLRLNVRMHLENVGKKSDAFLESLQTDEDLVNNAAQELLEKGSQQDDKLFFNWALESKLLDRDGPRYLGCKSEFHRALEGATRCYADTPRAPETPDEYRLMLRCIEYLLTSARQDWQNAEQFRYWARKWAEQPFYRYAMSVEQAIPYAEDEVNFIKASIAIDEMASKADEKKKHGKPGGDDQAPLKMFDYFSLESLVLHIKYSQNDDPLHDLSKHLVGQLPDKIRNDVILMAGWLGEIEQEKRLVVGLNEIFAKKLFDEKLFAKIQLSAATNLFKDQPLSGNDLVRLNHMLFKEAFEKYLPQITDVLPGKLHDLEVASKRLAASESLSMYEKTGVLVREADCFHKGHKISQVFGLDGKEWAAKAERCLEDALRLANPYAHRVPVYVAYIQADLAHSILSNPERDNLLARLFAAARNAETAIDLARRQHIYSLENECIRILAVITSRIATERNDDNLHRQAIQRVLEVWKTPGRTRDSAWNDENYFEVFQNYFSQTKPELAEEYLRSIGLDYHSILADLLRISPR